ncbi:DUF7144 family membrane protein [Streptomyces griseus]|uniref:DUF7144 family membrane protein n=1 Tax=Streptomyces griseus TaxID=1911 RepID=UPI0036FBEF6D
MGEDLSRAADPSGPAPSRPSGFGQGPGSGPGQGDGILFASLGLVAHFLFLPYAPLWSTIVIALALFVIWALAAYRDPDPDSASATAPR